MKPVTAQPPRELGNPLLRSFVSLALVLHLLCVAFVYSANHNPSRLQQRLAGVLAPYTQLLHLDPGGARLQFTTGLESSDDHLVIVFPKRRAGEPDDDEPIRLPAGQAGASPQRQRELTIVAEMALYFEQSGEDAVAPFAQAIGASVMRQMHWDHVIVRLEHKGHSPLYDDIPEQERSGDYTLYEAEVWIDEDGEIHTQKRATGLQAAPASQGGSS